MHNTESCTESRTHTVSASGFTIGKTDALSGRLVAIYRIFEVRTVAENANTVDYTLTPVGKCCIIQTFSQVIREGCQGSHCVQHLENAERQERTDVG